MSPNIFQSPTDHANEELAFVNYTFQQLWTKGEPNTYAEVERWFVILMPSRLEVEIGKSDVCPTNWKIALKKLSLNGQNTYPQNSHKIFCSGRGVRDSQWTISIKEEQMKLFDMTEFDQICKAG